MPKSTYYIAIQSINKDDKYSKMKEAIKHICTYNKGRYEFRRVTLKLKSGGFKVNHKVVMKLMKQAGLICKARLKNINRIKENRAKQCPIFCKGILKQMSQIRNGKQI